jgi:hypothetical protein
MMCAMSMAFVILEHAGHGPSHYDLMLDQEGEGLATWRIEDWRRLKTGCHAAARRLADHRREYLTHEGPVGGGRGRVRRVEEGVYELSRREDGLWEVRLIGRQLRGRFELRRVGPAQEQWELSGVSECAKAGPSRR